MDKNGSAEDSQISSRSQELKEWLNRVTDRSKKIDEPALADLAMRLLNAEPELLRLLQNDAVAAVTVIEAMDYAGRRDAVVCLLSNLEIAQHEANLLKVAIEVGLGGDSRVRHRWMIDDDVAQQRIDMIEGVVLPYVYSSAPEKKVFIALKNYEAKALRANRSNFDKKEMYALLEAVRLGNHFCTEGSDPVGIETKRQGILLAFQHDVFKTLLRLSWVAEEYLLELHERCNPEEFVVALKGLENIVPVCLIPTHLGYPMGGGESFVHQSCRVLNEFAIRCVWMSFLDPHNGWHTEDSFTTTPYYIDIRRAGGCSKEALLLAVEKFRPSIMHAHGGTADLCMEVAKECRITSMVGYHFWHGLIDLGPTRNSHILENISQHTLNSSCSEKSPLIFKYVASEFMLEVYRRLGGDDALNVIHPLSDAAQFAVAREDIGRYVLQVNTAVLKGGAILLDCVEALGANVPFMGIQSEPEDPAFNERLAAKFHERPICQLRQYGNVRDFYRTARMVIVPTLVDETFCRVAFEAAMNGIPVISTSNGFLRQMLGETGVFLSEESSEWITCIDRLYADTEELKKIGARQQARLMAVFGRDSARFANAAMDLIDNSSTKNIGIFTVWGDQGIGNLSHTHAKVLRRAGYKVHIFSAQPYAAIGRALMLQANPADWSCPENADTVFYSFNHREAVTVHELTQFVLSHDIHVLIVPEVCWQPNWDRLFALQIKGLSICSIPMIEIVIKEEIPNHNLLTSTFYCTRSAEGVLSAAGIRNGAFLGYGFGKPLSELERVEKRGRLARRSKIHYLHVAGHNPRTRKNTPKVIEAFCEALKTRNDIQLTVTSMDPVESYYSGELPPGIEIIDRRLSRHEIHALYQDHDVSIQVSSHEGLGLGFYESIGHGTPVLSLDAPPHNEIVIEGQTGWLIPAFPIPIPDNSRAVVDAWRFYSADLADRIVHLEKDEILDVIVSAAGVFRAHFDETALLGRFIKVLPRPIQPQSLIEFIGESEVDSESNKVLDDGACTSASDSALSTSELVQVAAPAPAPAPPNWKAEAKRMLRRGAQRSYQFAKPVARIIARKLRTLMIEAGADIRIEVREMRNEIQMFAHENRALAKEVQNAFDASISMSERRQANRLMAQLDRKLSKIFQEDRVGAGSVDRIAADLQYLKRRISTYAGEGVVLTYLRDGAPIFVNTGDLGCPSPIIDGGVWEPENLSVLYSFLTPDAVFLDIGANVGYFSIALGNRLKRGGRVFAFEPHAMLAKLIERSVQLNSLESVVKVFDCAVSDREGVLDLFYPEGHLGRGSAVGGIEERGVTLRVEVNSVDALLDSKLEVDLVKIDVEGYELPVLKGMVNVFQRSPKIKVLFEKLKSGDFESEEIGGFMRERGLSLYGVGAHSILTPLDLNAYTEWIGDVLAAPSGAVDDLSRNKFSIYPGCLYGDGRNVGGCTQYVANKGNEILFFGPNWYLQKGMWRVVLKGAVGGAVRLGFFDEHGFPFADIYLASDNLEGSIALDHDVGRFELRAYATGGSSVELERIDFIRA